MFFNMLTDKRIILNFEKTTPTTKLLSINYKIIFSHENNESTC